MTGNRGITGIIEALKRQVSGAVSGFRMHSGYVGRRRSAHDRWADRSRYRADNLPAIRKRKGVGRPKEVTIDRRDMYAKWIALPLAIKPYLGADLGGWNTETPNRNLAEWERKPRRKDRAAA